MRGRPILGALAGLLFGFFLALALQQWSVRPLDNLSVVGLPIIGLIFGLLLAWWAPFGRREPRTVPPEQPSAPPNSGMTTSPPEPPSQPAGGSSDPFG